jgi:hypothetical protein
VHSAKRIIEGKRFGPPVPTFRGPLGHRISQSKSQSLSNPTSTNLNRILESLAHIFALQAFHQYQYNLKKEKQKMPSATPTIPVSKHSSRLYKRIELTVVQRDQNARELSPESAKIYALTPIAPSGTRRRPAKKAGATVDEIFDRNEYAQYVYPG